MSDTDIAGAVRRLLATLLDDLDLVQVEVEQGVVYLEGIARTAAQKERIDHLIGRLPGVEQVVNCLALEHLAALHATDDLVLLVPDLAYYDWTSADQGGFGTS